ncbi:MAG TPA: HAMP domain-containing protein, partial [Polyangiaceae bacterium]
MKIVSKLTVMFILSISLVLGSNGFLRVQREVGLFESDRVSDHEVMAQVLARAALAVWRSDGPNRAIAMIDELGLRTDKFHIHWHAFGDPANAAIDAKLERLAPNGTLTFADVPVDRERGRCIYATLDTAAPPTGAISLCETFAAQNAYVRKTIAETVLTTLVLAAVSALLSVLLGMWLVGKPVAALSAKALRIGAGDFSAPLELERKDELARRIEQASRFVDLDQLCLSPQCGFSST